MVTKIEREIIDILRERKIEKDDVLGYMCAVRQGKSQEKILAWLKQHPKADKDDIGDEIFSLIQE